MTPPQSRWANAGLVVLIVVVLLNYASLFRPMWFDEFVQFALGGMRPGEAMQAILDTTGSGLNQGHTGVYLVLDYWLLQAFGANLIALRAPSIAAGALLLIAAVTFIRLKGFGPPWQALMVLGLAAQWAVMYYAGEARPYMPLVASSAATLAYYQYAESERHRLSVRAMGIAGIWLGAVSHPYFGLMALAIGVFSLWDRGILRQPWRLWVKFANPWLVVPGVLIYGVVGALTWGKARPADRHEDPWYWFQGPARAWSEFVYAHTQVFQPLRFHWLLALVVVVVVAIALTRVSSLRVTSRPLVLMGTGVLTSAVISVASIRGDYWVFSRQWVAGMALVTIGWVWLLASSWRAVPSDRRAARALVLSLAGIVVAAGVLQLMLGFLQNQFYRGAWPEYLGTAGPRLPGPSSSADDWVLFANHNVADGGPVWPEVSRYYDAWLPDR